MKFKDEKAIWRKKLHQFLERNLPGEGCPMVLKRPAYIVNMAAHGAGPHLSQPVGMIQQTEVVLDLGVAKVMPVPCVGSVESLEEVHKLMLGGHGLVVLAVLDAQPNALLRGIVGDLHEAVQGSLDVDLADLLAFEYGSYLLHSVTAGEVALLFHHLRR